MAHEKCLELISKRCDCIPDDIKRLGILENLWQELKAKEKGLYEGDWELKTLIKYYRKQLG